MEMRDFPDRSFFGEEPSEPRLDITFSRRKVTEEKSHYLRAFPDTPSLLLVSDFTVLQHFESRDGKLAQQLPSICSIMSP